MEQNEFTGIISGSADQGNLPLRFSQPVSQCGILLSSPPSWSASEGSLLLKIKFFFSFLTILCCMINDLYDFV